ncbi:DNA-binding transcriptional LysR family regulator [Halanaerobium saccharolyticum]|uniref:DNA-binding transcriptional LysR family regulator n=1 Tax=Halanaerobium saccharolyticum TaxID=43595 RepID=A0A4R6LZC1_9FIRM|nr:LysR family transcriptional regulator [Halanaerobium saccharolyticum]TDO94173.1 DNA-binding transcriptional LysR family regulator [Halanaerobium saccharolyticum]
MNIDDLKYFIKVFENENLTKSAKELFITQQALSQKISKLEAEIGVKLFERNSRGVSPTEFAEYFYPEAKGLKKYFDDFKSEVYRKAEKEKKKLKIGFSPGTLQVLNAQDIIENSRQELGIEIEISEFTDVDCEKNVLNNNLDLAITVNPQNSDDFNFKSLYHDNFAVVVKKSDSLAKEDELKLVDIKNRKLILLDETFRMQTVLEREFKKADFEPEVYSRCNHDLDAAYEFVSLNKGVFVFVDSLIYLERYPDLSKIPIKDLESKWEIGIITKKEANIGPNVKKFINFYEAENDL